MLQILRNTGGMFTADAQMSSMNTLATTLSWSAFFCSSSVLDTRAGSSSRSRSFDVSISRSTTFWSVFFR
jgi:hypothetical protein